MLLADFRVKWSTGRCDAPLSGAERSRRCSTLRREGCRHIYQFIEESGEEVRKTSPMERGTNRAEGRHDMNVSFVARRC
jgi:hypothetical protein